MAGPIPHMGINRSAYSYGMNNTKENRQNVSFCAAPKSNVPPKKMTGTQGFFYAALLAIGLLLTRIFCG